MDTVYQIIVLKRFYPTEAVGIAVLLAFVPYLVIRGPVARLARQWPRSAPPHKAGDIANDRKGGRFRMPVGRGYRRAL
jgi:hypothetical protein